MSALANTKVDRHLFIYEGGCVSYEGVIRVENDSYIEAQLPGFTLARYSKRRTFVVLTGGNPQAALDRSKAARQRMNAKIVAARKAVREMQAASRRAQLEALTEVAA